MPNALTRFLAQSTIAVLVGAALLVGVGGEASGAVPSGFAETRVAAGITAPTAMAIAPDGRLFVAEQAGKLRIIRNGILLPAPFANIAVDSNGERGLLGIAFDPSFTTNHFLYVYHTVAASPAHNRVVRFTASGDKVVARSGVAIMDLESLSSATNHNGGAIHFGPDGRLYVAVGDNANSANSQTKSNRLGKLLRINSNGTIPSSNPFFTTSTGLNRAIWALGLRNPYTFTFMPGSSRMFINDVGQSSWEEINDGIAGSNYGWPTTEGETTDPRYRSPLYAYGHGSGPDVGCAITGGAFYKPSSTQFPSSYVGDYFFADFCSGWIRSYDPGTDTVTGFASGISSPVDLTVSNDGSLYYLARGGGGGVFRITYAAAHGVPGTYSNNADFTGSHVNRIDSAIDFNWGTGSPAPGIAADTFSVRWLAAVQVPADGTYRFYTQSDEGVRLWVDGNIVVNNWTGHALTENSGTVALASGVRHTVQMEFFDGTGVAVARLLWSGPSVVKAVIPNSALYRR
jgi:glucose/arabinose dehydrogenase